MTKKCSFCKLVKTYQEFNKDRKKKDGCASRCKKCQSAYSAQWKLKNIEQVRANNETWRENNRIRRNASRKRYYEKNKDRLLTNMRKQYSANPSAAKNRDLKKNYGIDINAYNALLLIQNYSCKICNRHKDEFDRALAVDHCHKTDKIRGLLCTNCNRAVGNLKDSEQLAFKAFQYLSENKV